MNATRVYRLICLPALLLLLASLAFADSATLTLNSVHNNDGHYYTYPYDVTVTNGSGSTAYTVACVDVFDQVHVGDSWVVNVINLGDALNDSNLLDQTRFGTTSNAALGYEEEAWLYSNFGSDNSTNNQIQHAIWDIFDPGFSSQTGDWLDQAETASENNFNGLDFGQFTLFSPQLKRDRWDGQEYMTQTPPTPTPEPLSLVLLASGLLLVGLTHKRWGWQRS